MNILSEFSAFLALCGIVSIRNFMPVFFFALGKRLSLEWAGCPEPLRTLFERAPDWLSCDFTLVVLAALAIWELLANWNDSARELLDETKWDIYIKPIIAFLASYVLLAPHQSAVFDFVANSGTLETLSPLPPSGAEMTQEIVVTTNAVIRTKVPVAVQHSGLVGFSSIILSFFAAGITYVLSFIRLKTAAFLRGIDPDNSLKLHTLAAFVEETTWVALAICAIAFPLLVAFIFAMSLLFEEVFRHCANRIVEWLLLPPRNLSDPAVALAYRKRLIRFHRCPYCRTPLGKDHFCKESKKEPWEDSFSCDDFVHILDVRCAIIMGFAIVLSILPVAGYIFGSLALSLAVIAPLRQYTHRGNRFLASCLFRIFKIVTILFALALSIIPFSGVFLLIPKLFSYFAIRKSFLSLNSSVGVQ